MGPGGRVWGAAGEFGVWRGEEKRNFFQSGAQKKRRARKGARREGICGVMGVSRGRGGRILRIKDMVTHPKNTIWKEYGKFYMIVR